MYGESFDVMRLFRFLRASRLPIYGLWRSTAPAQYHYSKCDIVMCSVRKRNIYAQNTRSPCHSYENERAWAAIAWICVFFYCYFISCLFYICHVFLSAAQVLVFNCCCWGLLHNSASFQAVVNVKAELLLIYRPESHQGYCGHYISIVLYGFRMRVWCNGQTGIHKLYCGQFHTL